PAPRRMGKSPLVNTTAIARNAPCPCGSGKRYKDCHGATAPGRDEPSTADSLLRDAQVAFSSGRGPAALELVRRALELAPERADLLRERARIEWTLNDANAEASCRAALAFAPDDVRALNLLGEILSATDPAAAEAAWKHADALANLANLLKTRKCYREAVLAYEKAIQVRRDFPVRFWVSRGVALGELGALADAEASFREAARLDPDQAATQIDLGSLCIV